MADKFVKANPFAASENREKVQPKRPTVEEPVKVEQESTTELAQKLLGDLSKKKPAGKNFTIYLDLDVVAAADNLAKDRGESRSSVMNKILRQVLLGE